MIALIKNNKITKLFSPIMIMAGPIIIQGFIFQIESLTNKAFLGNLDPLYLSALGAAQFPFNTTLDSLVALCTGVTILVSQLHGAKKKTEIKNIVNSALLYNSILSLFLFILWFKFPQHIFNLMNVDKKIMGYSIDYVKISSLFMLLLGMDASLQAVLQGLGRTKPIMYTGIIKVTLNLFLDWIFIFGHFGLPALQIRGAALASAIANSVSFILLLSYFLINTKAFYGEEHQSSFHSSTLSAYKNIIKLGLPTCLEFFLWNFSNLILVKFLNGFGVAAVAVYTITFSIEIIIYMIFNGISKSALTLVGHKIGAKDTEGARTILSACMLLNLVVVTCFLIVSLFLPSPILRIFTSDAAIINSALPFLLITAVILFPKSINATIGSGIRAYGNTKWMLYTQIIGSIFVITCSYIFINSFHLNVMAIYLTILFDEIVRASINTYYYCKGKITHKTRAMDIV